MNLSFPNGYDPLAARRRFFCASRQSRYYQSMPELTHLESSMERRECHRLPCRAPVRIYAEPHCPSSDSFILESADISPEGLFLHTELLFPVGEWLDLEFVVPGRARPVRGRGKVVRVNATYLPPGPGVAVHLPGLALEERSALSRLGSVPVRVRPG
jgi:hypothetical protein